MTRRVALLASTAAAVLLPVHVALAQSSPGCDDLQRAAAAGMEMRIAADDAQIAPPMSVRELTCMSFFFDGDIFNVVTDFGGYLVGMLTEAAFREACNLARQAWDATLGNIQCGITLQGLGIGFGGSLGGGNFCPVVSLGGNGPTIASATLSAGARYEPYIGVSPMAPTGYPVTLPLGRAW